MKISIEKNSIYKSLSHVQSIVEKKNTIPILSNILLEAIDSSLILSATDMDISITEAINCSVIETGSATVPAHTLYDIVRKIPDGNEIEFISNDGKTFSIRSGISKFSLSSSPLLSSSSAYLQEILWKAVCHTPPFSSPRAPRIPPGRSKIPARPLFFRFFSSTILSFTCGFSIKVRSAKKKEVKLLIH